MARQTFICSRETRSKKALVVTKQKSKVGSKSEVTSNSSVKMKMPPKSDKKQNRSTKVIELKVKNSDTPSPTLNGSAIIRLTDIKKSKLTVKQAVRKANNGKTNAVRNRKRGTDVNGETEIVEKSDEDRSKPEKSSRRNQDKVVKNLKSGNGKAMDSKSTIRCRTKTNASPNKAMANCRSANKKSTTRPKTNDGKSNAEVEKSEADKNSSQVSRSVQLARTATNELSNGVKVKSETRERKQLGIKGLPKDNVKKRVVAKKEIVKSSTDKRKSKPQIEKSSKIDKTEGKSNDEESVVRSPPKKKSKTNVLETLEKSLNKSPSNEIKNKIENKKASKRKRNENGVDVSTDSALRLGVATNDSKQVDASPGPSAKKRKTSASVDRKKSVSKKVTASAEDPYDFEAYLSTITPGKRKRALDAEKTKAASNKRVWGRRPPQRTPWGGVAMRGKTPTHKFFIQPSRPKKKAQPEHPEEPSPSIAEEIVEFTLQPPFVPVDDDEPGRPLGVPSSSMIISTPRTQLTAAPILRPLGASVISPIPAPCADGAAQGKLNTSTTENVELAASKTSEAKISSQPEPTKLEIAKKCVTQPANEKDEFEVWLEKFSRELSDIESFELSVERS